jgi:hypothetical protein
MMKYTALLTILLDLEKLLFLFGGHTEAIKVQLVLIVERLMSTPAATQSKSELVCV